MSIYMPALNKGKRRLLATFNTTGTTELGETTSIPPGLNRIQLLITNVQVSPADFLYVALGDSTGYAVNCTGGCKYSYAASGITSVAWAGTGWGVIGRYQTSGDILEGVVNLLRIPGTHSWHVNAQTSAGAANYASMDSNGFINNGVEIDRLKLKTGGTFNGGQCDVFIFENDAY